MDRLVAAACDGYGRQMKQTGKTVDVKVFALPGDDGMVLLSEAHRSG